MYGELNRYFIELHQDGFESVPRHMETEQRRAAAAQFLENVGKWLHDKELSDKVSALAITALGQVQITCEPDVINHIRGHENVAMIRPSAMPQENTGRWSEAR